MVLNQADRLTAEAVDGHAARTSRRLSQEDGVDDVEVLATSARDRQRGGGPAAPDQHGGGGAHRCGAAPDGDVPRWPPAARGRRRHRAGVDAHADAELVDALTRAAGVPVVLDAVERDYRREAFAHTGWPFTRWVRSLRPDPLRRLRLSAARWRGQA